MTFEKTKLVNPMLYQNNMFLIQVFVLRYVLLLQKKRQEEKEKETRCNQALLLKYYYVKIKAWLNDKAAKTLKSSKFLNGTAKGFGKNADDVVVVGAKVGGFNPSQLYKNALSKFNSEGLTNAGRALPKHPSIVGQSKQTFNTVYKTVQSQNNAANSFLKNLLRNNNGNLIEFRNSQGLGARWTLDGKFIGFVE